MNADHVAHLNQLTEANGFNRNEVVRRAVMGAEIPSGRTLQEVQDLRTRTEVERNAAELRRVVAYLVRCG